MKIVVRHACSEFDALTIADAMESVGVLVFSITYDGTHKLVGAIDPCSRFTVWAKYDSDHRIIAMDDVIDAARDKNHSWGPST